MFVIYPYPSQLGDTEKQRQVSSFAARGRPSATRKTKPVGKVKLRLLKGRPLKHTSSVLQDVVVDEAT